MSHVDEKDLFVGGVGVCHLKGTPERHQERSHGLLLILKQAVDLDVDL